MEWKSRRICINVKIQRMKVNRNNRIPNEKRENNKSRLYLNVRLTLQHSHAIEAHRKQQFLEQFQKKKISCSERERKIHWALCILQMYITTGQGK